MQIGRLLAPAVMGLVVMAETGIGRSIVNAPVTPQALNTVHRQTRPGDPTPLRYDDHSVKPSAPASAHNMDVPLAYYTLSFTLSKRTAGITPPVQARTFAYMGLPLFESIVDGMPHNRSIASSLHDIGPLPRNRGTKVLASRRERIDGRGDAWALG